MLLLLKLINQHFFSKKNMDFVSVNYCCKKFFSKQQLKKKRKKLYILFWEHRIKNNINQEQHLCQYEKELIKIVQTYFTKILIHKNHVVIQLIINKVKSRN